MWPISTFPPTCRMMTWDDRSKAKFPDHTRERSCRECAVCPANSRLAEGGRHPQCRQEGGDPRRSAAAWMRGPKLIDLAEKVGAPIIKPLLGKAVVPDDSPYTTGGIGLLGTASRRRTRCRGATRCSSPAQPFPYMEFYPKPGNARCVQIDIDPARIGLRYPMESASWRLPKALPALLPMIRRKEDRSFLEQARKDMKKWEELMEQRSPRQDKPMKPQVIAWDLSKFLPDDAILVSDSRHRDDVVRAAHYLKIATACCSRLRHAWRRWPTACRTPSRRRSPTRAARSSASSATAASQCSWASWRRW